MRERPRRRERRRRARRGPRRSGCSELGSSATSRVQARGLRGEARAKKVLKLTISSPSSCSWTFSAAVTLPMLATSFERSCGSVPVIAWLRIARAAQRRGPALVGQVERLRGVEAAHFRFLFGVFGGVGLRVSAVAVVDQEVLQVRARVGVQRVEHLVELHRVGGLGDRDRVARGDRLRRRAAGLQFDEPVAFQERCAGGS